MLDSFPIKINNLFNTISMFMKISLGWETCTPKRQWSVSTLTTHSLFHVAVKDSVCTGRDPMPQEQTSHPWRVSPDHVPELHAGTRGPWPDTRAPLALCRVVGSLMVRRDGSWVQADGWPLRTFRDVRSSGHKTSACQQGCCQPACPSFVLAG